MKTIPISITEVELIAYRLAEKLMKFNELIPEFGTRFPSILESCLVTPFQKFGGKFLYEGLVKKAAVLFYLMIKNHPFKNGNKRIARRPLVRFITKRREEWLIYFLNIVYTSYI